MFIYLIQGMGMVPYPFVLNELKDNSGTHPSSPRASGTLHVTHSDILAVPDWESFLRFLCV